jgi:hypothetical protein
MFKRALTTLIFAASVVGTQAAAGQDVQSPRDSVIVRVVHVDSASQLTLTTQQVVFAFTPLGVERARRRADSTTGDYSDRGMANLVRASVGGALQGMRIPFQIDDIASARSVGRTISIDFKSAGVRRNDRTEQTFDFDAVDERSARAFATRLNELVARRR